MFQISFLSHICWSYFTSPILFYFDDLFSFCACTQSQPGRKTWDYCNSHSAPSWPTARLCWAWCSFSSARCSPWELFPGENLVLPVARAHPLSSSPPTCSSLLLLYLYPLWASFPAVESPLPTFGVPCLCLSREAWLWECTGSLAASLTWAWRDQSGVSGLVKLSCYAWILSEGLHTFPSCSPPGHPAEQWAPWVWLSSMLD